MGVFVYHNHGSPSPVTEVTPLIWIFLCAAHTGSGRPNTCTPAILPDKDPMTFCSLGKGKIAAADLLGGIAYERSFPADTQRGDHDFVQFIAAFPRDKKSY